MRQTGRQGAPDRQADRRPACRAFAPGASPAFRRAPAGRLSLHPCGLEPAPYRRGEAGAGRARAPFLRISLGDFRYRLLVSGGCQGVKRYRLCAWSMKSWLNPISVSRQPSFSHPFLLRLQEQDYLAYVASAARQRTSVSQYLRDCIRVGARQLSGERAVAPVQNKGGRPQQPALPARQVRTPVEARAVAASSDGRCQAHAGRGLRCRVCGKVHTW